MGQIKITHKEFGWGMPYQVLINGQMIGLMKKKQAIVRIPAGTYEITLRVGGFLPYGKNGKVLDLTLSSTEKAEVDEENDTIIEFRSKERVWNILFDIDMIAWIAGFFVTLPHPWHLVYEIVSNLFFVIWLIRLYMVRKNYFHIQCKKEPHLEKETK